VLERALSVVAIRRGGGGVAVPSQRASSRRADRYPECGASARRFRWIRTSADRPDTTRPALASAFRAGDDFVLSHSDTGI
jgi:hypothetical protein